MESKDIKKEFKPEVEKRPINHKNFRAFLIYCISLQQKNLDELEVYDDKLHNLLRKSTNSSMSKKIKLDIIKVSQAKRDTRAKINSLQYTFSILSEFETLNGQSYKLTDAFIKKESNYYEAVAKSKEEPVKSEEPDKKESGEPKDE